MNHFDQWRMVIMRPQGQADQLAADIKALAGEPILLPMLQILPLEIDIQAISIENPDYIIVSSVNAVRYAPVPMWNLWPTAKIISMGKATTRALLDLNQKVFFTLPAGGTSESLLVEPFLQAEKISHKSFILLAGEGGRTFLAENLFKRGVKITWVKVYQQVCPQLDLRAVYRDWQDASQPFCFIASSQNCLENLLALTPPSYLNWLYTKPLVVLSERTKLFATQKGFIRVALVTDLEVKSLLKGLGSVVS